MWLNEHEIDEIAEVMERRAPDLAGYAKFLKDWKDTVNGNSDGWAYWKAGTKCADGLSAQLKKALDAIRNGREPPSEEVFKRTLTPIRAAATRHNLTAPAYEAPSPEMRP